VKRGPALVGGVVAFAVVLALCLQAELTPGASWTAAVTALCAVWWVTEPIPIPVTSLLPFVIFPLVGVLDHKAVATAYGHTLILLLLGGFIMSEAMARSGAHKRLAVGMVRLAGGRGGATPKRLILGFMLACALTSMWISNTATTLMLLPVAIAVIQQDEANGGGQLALPLLLGLAWSASIGGMGTPVGTPPNVILMGVYREVVGQDIGFAQWMAMGLPVVLVLVPLAWLWVTRGVGRGTPLTVPEVGPWSTGERRVLVVFGLTAFLWVTRTAPFGGWSTLLSSEGAITAFISGNGDGMHPGLLSGGWIDASGAGDSTIALGAVVALFLVPDGKGSQLLDWQTARRIPWGLLLLFGGGIAIAKAFGSTGLSASLGAWLADDVGIATWPLLLMLLGVCLVVTFLTEVTSNTATTTLLMPVLAAAALAAELEPMQLMVPAALSASCAFMLPVATAPNAIVYGTDRVPVHRMAREGLALNLGGAVVIAVLCAVMLG